MQNSRNSADWVKHGPQLHCVSYQHLPAWTIPRPSLAVTAGHDPPAPANRKSHRLTYRAQACWCAIPRSIPKFHHFTSDSICCILLTILCKLRFSNSHSLDSAVPVGAKHMFPIRLAPPGPYATHPNHQLSPLRHVLLGRLAEPTDPLSCASAATVNPLVQETLWRSPSSSQSTSVRSQELQGPGSTGGSAGRAPLLPAPSARGRLAGPTAEGSARCHPVPGHAASRAALHPGR